VHPRDEHDHLADCPEIDQENWSDDWTSRKRAGAAFFVAGKHVRLCDFSAEAPMLFYIRVCVYIYIFFFFHRSFSHIGRNVLIIREQSFLFSSGFTEMRQKNSPNRIASD